jgi:hypothetical protein
VSWSDIGGQAPAAFKISASLTMNVAIRIGIKRRIIIDFLIRGKNRLVSIAISPSQVNARYVQRPFQSDLAGLIDSMRDARKNGQVQGIGSPPQTGWMCIPKEQALGSEGHERVRALFFSVVIDGNQCPHRGISILPVVRANCETAVNLEIDIPLTFSLRAPRHALVACILNSEAALLFTSVHLPKTVEAVDDRTTEVLSNSTSDSQSSGVQNSSGDEAVTVDNWKVSQVSGSPRCHPISSS